MLALAFCIVKERGQAVVPLDLKLVSVKFEAFGAALPTLYLGFCLSVSKNGI